MNALSMILRVAAVAAGIAAAVGWFLVQGKLEEKTMELEQASAEASSARNTLAEIQGKIATLESQLRTRDSEIAEEKSRSSRLNTQLLQARRDIGDFQEKATSATNRVSSLEDTIRQLRTELVAVRTEAPSEADKSVANEEAQAQITKLSRELESASTRIARLESDLESAKKAAVAAEGSQASGTTAKTPARPGTQSTAGAASGPTTPGTISIPTAGTPIELVAVESVPTGLISSIASVNRSAGLIALNSGSSQGIQPGQVVILRDGFSDLARVQIAETRDGFSVARILPDSLNPGALRAGKSVELVQ